MTGPDLIRLAHDLAECGGVHRLTNCITAACHVFAEHERHAARRAAVEAWEDGPVGCGMSDKAVDPWNANREHDPALLTADRDAASRAPAGDDDAGGVTDYANRREAMVGISTGLAADFAESAARCAQRVNPAPVTPDRGERAPLPRPVTKDEADILRQALLASSTVVSQGHLRGGITHGEGSPVTAQHSGPSDMARKRCVPRFERINPEDDGA